MNFLTYLGLVSSILSKVRGRVCSRAKRTACTSDVQYPTLIYCRSRLTYESGFMHDKLSRRHRDRVARLARSFPLKITVHLITAGAQMQPTHSDSHSDSLRLALDRNTHHRPNPSTTKQAWPRYLLSSHYHKNEYLCSLAKLYQC